MYSKEDKVSPVRMSLDIKALNIEASHKKMLLMLQELGALDTECILLANSNKIGDLYRRIIRSEDALQFNEYIKIAAFFMAHLLILKKTVHSREINLVLAEMNPASLRDKLKKILNKLGGYTFMPNEEKNITLGVEIEYSNIPKSYKELTELVMENIQQGWSHPGDTTVDYRPEDYGGEATTPIISNDTDLKAAMLNVAFLQIMGATTNDSCGLHVHVGVANIATPDRYKKIEVRFDEPLYEYTNYQLEFIKQFLHIYKREAARFALIERTFYGYALEVSIPMEINEIPLLSRLIGAINPNGRYYELNLHAFLRHGTIEIRRFSGTTEEAQVYATIAMVAAMANEAKARTNQIFDAKLKPAKIVNLKGELRTHYQEGDNLPLSFVKQEHTERQRELFMLRIKPLHESKLVIITRAKAAKLNASIKEQERALIHSSLIEYQLDRMWNDVLRDKTIECEFTEQGIKYRVIGLDKKIKNGLILWEMLPKDFPRHRSILVAHSGIYLPTIMEFTSKNCHTPSANRVYIYLNRNGLNFMFFNAKGHQKTGIIEKNKRFSPILEKLRSREPLTGQENKQLLYEVSMQHGALKSHSVGILAADPQLSSLFSKPAREKAKGLHVAPQKIEAKSQNERAHSFFAPADQAARRVNSEPVTFSFAKLLSSLRR